MGEWVPRTGHDHRVVIIQSMPLIPWFPNPLASKGQRTWLTWLDTTIHSRYVKGRDATTEDGQSYRNGRTAYCKRSGYLFIQPFIPFRKWLWYDGQVSEGAKPLVPVLCHPMPSIQKHRWAQQMHLISYPSGSPLVCLPGQALPRQHHGQDRADQQVKKASLLTVHWLQGSLWPLLPLVAGDGRGLQDGVLAHWVPCGLLRQVPMKKKLHTLLLGIWSIHTVEKSQQVNMKLIELIVEIRKIIMIKKLNFKKIFDKAHKAHKADMKLSHWISFNI